MVFTYRTLNQRPSRPECSISVSNPSELSRSRNINAIVDSGADMTCIPESVIQALGSLIQGEIGLRDVNGNVAARYIYVVELNIFSNITRRVEVLSIPKDNALIGRDILNEYKIVLDAPSTIWRLNCREICKSTSPGENGD
ncbi:MAG: retroviral-like aspartic protease family protein [Tatlockia sp.]|nr:retroviral-like aspartic protease family protein [Tatlockia sp.]